jgi:lipocalin
MNLEVFILILATISSQAILNHHPIKDGCFAVSKPKENLALDRITGDWYEIKRFGLVLLVNVNY